MRQMPIHKTPVVAISSDFMQSFAAVPRQVQGKVLDFIEKFHTNPASPAINYEKIIQFRDKSLRSIRIDRKYRGIVKKPEDGNVYMLLWVDHHDKAYSWAKNKVCKVNPETGGLQVYEVDEASLRTVQKKIDRTEESVCLFADVRDRHLVKLGVPPELIPIVRSITTEDELDMAAQQLPEEAYESLVALAAGYSVEEILLENERNGVAGASVDANDFETALKQPDSKRRFVVVDDDVALKEIFDAPLEKWRVFLHPSQRTLVQREWNGAVRVLGGAGTGKTVVAMHRAKYLAEKVFTRPDDRILFTTFTRNLAADIRSNLAQICTPDVMQRIEVKNLDSWVSHFLGNNGYENKIDYGSRTCSLWNDALKLLPKSLELDRTFYREEWERVIQPQGVSSSRQYMRASRIGRGVPLTRSNRVLIWPVFERYRSLLNENNLKEVDDAMRDASAMIKESGMVLPYRAVVVDEAQDMGASAFRLIRTIAGEEHSNDIFIVGDAHQRIYRHRVVLKHCGIKVVGRSRKLRINYRTTEENRRWAVHLLDGTVFDDLDGGVDDQKGYTSLIHGSPPTVQHFESFQKELDFIATFLTRNGNKNGLHNVCLVARTNKLLQKYEDGLNARGVATLHVRREEADNRQEAGLRLATMHRVKGLEFDHVIIAGINKGVVPLENKWTRTGDKVIEKESEIQEKALLYVAATRAKKKVLLTSYGQPSKFLQSSYWSR